MVKCDNRDQFDILHNFFMNNFFIVSIFYSGIQVLFLYLFAITRNHYNSLLTNEMGIQPKIMIYFLNSWEKKDEWN